ncbi:MAG: nuclear transport factor 2 family protein [Rhodospirillaceae bacterium]|nr:nuclear transport factor 2 family protein [Rhodospirillaceae bacterium]
MTHTGDPHHDRLEDVIDRYLAVWRTGDADRLADLADLMDRDMRYRGPFHDATGREAVVAVWRSVFERIDHVHIDIRARARDDLVTLVLWTLRFRTSRGGVPRLLEGVAELRQNGDSGLIEAHFDHWDAAGQVYEDLSLLGWMIRLARRRIGRQPRVDSDVSDDRDPDEPHP